ncbi:phosphoribosylaminoimidazolesuccinocarboxamide synthase [Actinocrispum wychmicini]|uniref:Phosphoribosylaminoimidazole-succinocarboxamide synthase n=1 Tax=Actinocrispum wychmicini TaxID=1213861 RepID=A0A4R2K545_9PSEU|nr:phosphoribosylaminoimidazolesuccinocarboxamide synthase [Actinocrispum wychmicini]TCO64908.1 phosphoribosylaminoimidazole-succinocarboxamide synthase [Actinocrispum wychmicini]
MPTLTEYPQVAAGKVRELYAVDDDHLLLLASDRISAYDYVLPTTIPDKGRVLTAMSVFWFDLLGGANHLVSSDDPRIPDEVRGRALLVRRLRMLPVECVARGYLTGSGLADYVRTGSVCGVPLPSGLVEASKLPAPIFTPTTKAEVGQHDEAMDFAAVEATVGADLAARLRDTTLSIYRRAAEHAESRGMILADTKFEFGVDSAGEIVLADEVLTPDSSRYWAMDGYSAGRVQPAFDKQVVRDWLVSSASGWDRSSGEQPPELPADVVEYTRARYVEAYERVSGRKFADWA